jgi:hypothetical protein
MMTRLSLPYLICTGGSDATVYDASRSHVSLKCDDSYVGLPSKMITLFRFLTQSSDFSAYTHYVKLDEDLCVIRPLISSDLQDYTGIVYAREGNRRWHIGRCPGSRWNTEPYTGIYVPYCLGGYGYIVSRKAATAIASASIIPENEIYEDLMMGKILLSVGIYPHMLPKIRDYIRPL